MTHQPIRMDRRRLLALTGVTGLAVAGAATGCSAPAATDGPAEIRFAYWGSATRQEVTDKALQAFAAEHPDITVIPEFGPFDNYFERLATQTAGGDTPDVFQMNEKYLTEYADRGVLMGLEDIDTSAFAEGTREPGETPEGLFGLNAGVNAPTIMINPAVFEQLGLPIPDDTTWTWDDLAEIAVAATEASGGDVVGIGAMGGSDFAFHVDLRQQGQSIFTAEGGLGFGADALADWFARNLDLQRRRAVPSAAVSAENSGLPANQAPFPNGRQAMSVDYTNLINSVEQIAGSEMRLLRFPSRTGSAADAQLWLRASMFWSGYSRSERPDAARTLIDFLANSTACGEILLAERGIPANQTVRDDIAEQLSSADQKAVDYLEAIGSELGPAPVAQPVGGGDFPNVLSRMNQEVMFERLSPADAAARLISELETTLG